MSSSCLFAGETGCSSAMAVCIGVTIPTYPNSETNHAKHMIAGGILSPKPPQSPRGVCTKQARTTSTDTIGDRRTASPHFVIHLKLHCHFSVHPLLISLPHRYPSHLPTPTFAIMFGSTVASTLSPVHAAKFSGRYETTVVDAKTGLSTQVLRSLRHALVDKLMLQGTLTPSNREKAPAPTPSDIDDLCGVFKSKAKITPKKQTSSAPAAASVAKDVERMKISKASSNAGISRGNGEVKKVAASPARRRSRRISGCPRTRFSFSAYEYEE